MIISSVRIPAILHIISSLNRSVMLTRRSQSDYAVSRSFCRLGGSDPLDLSHSQCKLDLLAQFA